MIEHVLVTLLFAATVSVAAFLYARPFVKENKMLRDVHLELVRENQRLTEMISVEKEVVLAAKARADRRREQKEKNKGRDRWHPLDPSDADEDLYSNGF
jgi:hypothetical protein